MSDRRKTQTDHIRAARNWLGQAERSLEHENDVQGDLKLMLAKAELSRVEESPRVSRIRRWGIRLLPAAAAILLAGAGMMLWQEPPVGQSPLQENALPAPEPAAEAKTEMPVPAAVAEKESAARPALPDEAPVRAEERREKEAEPSAVSAAEPPEDTLSAPVQIPGQVPDAEKQRLMQSAGKVLQQ